MSDKIELKHGNGGVNMQQLINEITEGFPGEVDTEVDSAPFLNTECGQWVTTTDGFSVDPLFFPGGSIGSIAVNGTVNDLAVAGAVPKFLTLNLFLEEGLEKELLLKALSDFKEAAKIAKVKVIAGDTKVLPRGQVPGMLMATTGLGIRSPHRHLSTSLIEQGDVIVSSGTLGDHGAAVMLAREEFGLTGSLESCCASVIPFSLAALPLNGLRFMRDPTRGGLVTILHDLSRQTELSPHILEGSLPIKPQVKSVCAMLGYDPLVLASEGRVIAVVAPDEAEELVSIWKKVPGGESSAIIGHMADHKDDPVMITELGGKKYIAPLQDDPLPRIC